MKYTADTLKMMGLVIFLVFIAAMTAAAVALGVKWLMSFTMVHWIFFASGALFTLACQGAAEIRRKKRKNKED